MQHHNQFKEVGKQRDNAKAGKVKLQSGRCERDKMTVNSTAALADLPYNHEGHRDQDSPASKERRKEHTCRSTRAGTGIIMPVGNKRAAFSPPWADPAAFSPAVNQVPYRFVWQGALSTSGAHPCIVKVDIEDRMALWTGNISAALPDHEADATLNNEPCRLDTLENIIWKLVSLYTQPKENGTAIQGMHRSWICAVGLRWHENVDVAWMKMAILFWCSAACCGAVVLLLVVIVILMLSGIINVSFLHDFCPSFLYRSCWDWMVLFWLLLW